MTSIIHRILFLFKKLLLSFVRPELRLPSNGIIGSNTYFGKGRKIVIGERFFCGRNCHFSCHIHIGSDVLIASNVAMVGGDHEIDNISVPIRSSGRSEILPITVEDNVWIGHGAIVLHGVTIRSGAVIAAGSVVTKDVDRNSIVAGNPARPVRLRKFEVEN
jgi:acetyltransferase-like isoleucine patch superfamily enzyme